ncbi:MAG: oligosaccharide flippase family protein, partial [Candidatus Rokuibacteriota bacterium]
MSTRWSLRRSLRWAVVMNWGQRGIGAGFTYVLAAILGPREFGLVVLGLAFVELAQVFVEQGISTAIVQRRKLEGDHLDSAFWLSLAWGLVLAGGTVALSGWWAAANDAPELRNVVVALSALLVIWALMTVQMSLLQREGRFKELAICWNIGALAGGVCGLALALAGAGVWAFVAQQIVMDAVALVAMWAAARWAPRARFSRAHARELLGFSVNVFAANLGGFATRRSDTLLMGLFFGPAAVGLYRIADRLVELVLELTMRPVGFLALPFFSRYQDDPASLRATVEKCLRLALLITMPALLVVAATSEYVLAVLGDEWLLAADVLALLCVVGIVKGLVFFTGPLLFALGKPFLRAVILWTLGVLSAAAVVGVGLALEDAAVVDQIDGMAASRALVFLAAVLPVNVAILVRFGGVRLRTLASALPAVASGLGAFAVVAALGAAGVLDGLSPLPALVVAAGAASAVALAPVILFEPEARSWL